MACAATSKVTSGAAWVGATQRRTGFAATAPRATSSAKSICPKPALTWSSVDRCTIDYTCARAPPSMRATWAFRVRRSLNLGRAGRPQFLAEAVSARLKAVAVELGLRRISALTWAGSRRPCRKEQHRRARSHPIGVRLARTRWHRRNIVLARRNNRNDLHIGGDVNFYRRLYR